MPETPVVLLVSRDLFFASQISGPAQTLGLRVDVAHDAEQAAARMREGGLHGVLINLTLPGLNVADLLAAIPDGADRPRVVAFGPHVQTARLDAARQAGCDEVLPRSRFSAELPAILARILEEAN